MAEKTVAHELAERQRAISVAEFFEKNRHLLGFDSKIKALLTCIKEAIDNSLDASEDMIFSLRRDARKIYKDLEKAKKRGQAGKLKKLTGELEELKERTIDILPKVKVWIEEARREYKIVDYAKHERGLLTINNDNNHSIRIDGNEIPFERIRLKNFKISRGDIEILIDENKKNGFNIEYSLNKVKQKMTTQKNLTNRFKVIIQDNGPGVIPEQVPKTFGRLLYGSKFQSTGGGKQSRGQQGIGISAAILYAQLTTGKATRVISRISENKPAMFYDILIDTENNKPDILKQGEYPDFKDKHGVRVELELEGTYMSSGEKSVIEFLRRTSIANPHSEIIFFGPYGEKKIFKRATSKPPKEPKRIKPHPHGIEIGILQRMAKKTSKKTLLSFLTDELSRMGPTVAKRIIKSSGLSNNDKPDEIPRLGFEKMIKIMQKENIMKPPTDCLSPIGEDKLIKEIEVELKPEFVTAVTRNPEVYRGVPFQIEAAIAYGGNIPDTSARVHRFANKVPLMYEAGACATTQAVTKTDWRRYGLTQPSGSGLPQGRIIILVHVASVWVPFTSESKAAVASYPIITKEMKLALQECARKLGSYIKKRHKEQRSKMRINIFVKYSGELSNALAGLIEKPKESVNKVMHQCLVTRYGENYNKKGEVTADGQE